MAEPQTAMPRGDMKRLLAVSKKEPVNVAIGTGKDPGVALLLMDKIKQPKAVLKLLTTQFPDAKEPRWGTAFVDTDDDPKLVKFRLNRAGGSLARKIAKGLKGTGFSRVIILSDEDGSELDRHFGAEDEEEEGAPAAAPAEAAPPPVAAAEPAAPAFDLHELQKQLGELVGQVGKAAATVKAEAIKLAQEAGAQLKATPLDAAAATIAKLKDMLGGAAATVAAAAGTGAGSVAYGKSRLAWLATRQRLQADLAKLRAELDTEFKDEPEAQEVLQAYDTRIAPVIAAFDESLADKLDETTNATDAEQRMKLVTEAKAILAGYRSFLDGEPLIGDLDENPFVPLAIRKTMGATLTALEAAVR